jgi:hypothetical protein
VSVREFLSEAGDGRLEPWVELPDGTRLPAASYEAPRRLLALRNAASRKRKADRVWEEAILAARESGLSYRQIGAAAGLTHVGVGKLIRRVHEEEPD